MTMKRLQLLFRMFIWLKDILKRGLNFGILFANVDYVNVLL